MHKRYLPVLFAFLLFLSTCSKPASETTDAVGDSTTTSIPEDTLENGNMDGDYFVAEWIIRDTVPDYEPDEQMTGPHDSELDIAGFSADGKYFVFSQLMPGEYNGANGQVFAIDVAKNEWASKPAKLHAGEEEDFAYDEIKESLKIMTDSTSKKYGIKRGNFEDEFDFIDVNHNDVVMIQSQRYVLDLKVENNLIELRLKGNGKDVLLQKDKKMPASRGNVRRYRLNRAVVFGDKIAVFVEYDSEVVTGFENEHYYDRKNIAVTGMVK